MFRVAFILLSLCVYPSWAKLIDPTRPPISQAGAVNKEGKPLELKLQQILTRGGIHYALIDGHQVNVGQTLGEYTVLSIKSRQVVLEKTDRSQVTLTLFRRLKNSRPDS